MASSFSRLGEPFHLLGLDAMHRRFVSSWSSPAPPRRGEGGHAEQEPPVSLAATLLRQAACAFQAGSAWTGRLFGVE